MNTRATHKTDGSPVIGSVSLFVSTLWDAVDMMPKKWQHNFGDALRTSAMVLFSHAISQVNGANYYKRAVEVSERLHAYIYFAYSKKLITKKMTLVLDCDLELILKELKGNNYGQVAEVNSLDVEQ